MLMIPRSATEFRFGEAYHGLPEGDTREILKVVEYAGAITAAKRPSRRSAALEPGYRDAVMPWKD